jgi:hypothetical protein
VGTRDQCVSEARLAYECVGRRRRSFGTLGIRRRHSDFALIEKNHVEEGLQFREELVIDRHAPDRGGGYPGPARQEYHRRPRLGGGAPETDESDLNEPFGGTAAILPHPEIAEFCRMSGAVEGAEGIRFPGQIPGEARLGGRC